MFDLARENSYSTPLTNSSLLPFMLLSLATQKNSPSFTKTPSTIRPEYDFIVVGAGSAGSAVAARLSEIPCVSVLLIEAGGSPPLITDIPGYNTYFWNTDLNWSRRTVPQKNAGRLLNNRQFIWDSGKGLGGSSIINGMQYIRGNKKDYDDWAAQGAEGWSYKEVLHYFKKLEDYTNLKYVANGYHGIGGPISVEDTVYNPEIKGALFNAAKELGYKVVDVNGPHQIGFNTVPTNVRRGQRCSTAKGYLVPADSRLNFDILTNAFVTKVIMEDKRAVGVIFESANVTYNVTAKKEVILSAGAVVSPQLLMLSGIGPQEELQKHKIPVVADLPVGLNLHDHFIKPVDFLLDPSIPTASQKLSDKKNIVEYILKRRGPLAGAELMAAAAFLKHNLTDSPDGYPSFEIDFIENLGAFETIADGLSESAYKQIYGPYVDKPSYSCLVTLMHPKSRGKLTLQSADPYDTPLIDPNYLAEEHDVKDLVEGMKVCHKISSSKSMEQVKSRNFNTTWPGCEDVIENTDEYLECQLKAVGHSGFHFVGSVKMGSSSDPTTVVDPKLKVKGIQGLRVVDASIMPTVPSGNINIPVIMIGEKAADLIKEDIKCLSDLV